jgi:hypothetical protein
MISVSGKSRIGFFMCKAPLSQPAKKLAMGRMRFAIEQQRMPCRPPDCSRLTWSTLDCTKLPLPELKSTMRFAGNSGWNHTIGGIFVEVLHNWWVKGANLREIGLGADRACLTPIEPRLNFSPRSPGGRPFFSFIEGPHP